MNTNRLLTEKQAAELLQVKPKTVADWGRSGRLTRVRLTVRCIRYRVEDVEALFAAGLETCNPTAQNG